MSETPAHDPLGTYSLEEGQAVIWRLGPLWLEAMCKPGEWRLSWRQGKDPTTTDWHCTGPTGPVATEEDEHLSVVRHAATPAPAPLQIKPALADRPVVVRLESPLMVPVGGRAVIYVTTPIWCGVTAGEETLTEVPSWRPTDTWFGPTFREGILCYAGRTAARMRVADLLGLPYRAATEVTIVNRDSEPLQVERLSLPMDHLALYRGARGFLWTESVQVDWTGGPDPLPIRVIEGAPPEATAGELVGERRLPITGPLLFRMFSRLRRGPGAS